VLGTRRAFFGLIAAGWEIEDTTGKGARGPLPEEAVIVEHLVGLLDAERASGEILGAPALRDFLAAAGVTPPAALTDQTLGAIRALRGELFSRWQGVAPGRSMELVFGA